MTHTDFTDALYLTAAAGETKEDVFPILDENDKMLADQLPIVHAVLESTASTFPWPAPDVAPKAALALAKVYVQSFLERAEQSKLNRDVYAAMKEAIKTDVYPVMDALTTEIDSVLTEQDPVAMIDRLKEFAKKNDFSLGDDVMKQVDQARDVFIQIKDIDSNQDALTVVVELWEMTDEQNRQSTFEPVSKDLYDYLKGKGPKDLRCLKSHNCLNPIILIPKMIALKPAIEKYGLKKLQGEIQTAARDSLVKQITAAIATFVPEIPKQVEVKIGEQLKVIRDKIASVKKDYPGFLHGIAKQYLVQDLKQDGAVRISGLEANRVQIKLVNGSLDVSAVQNSGPATGAEVLGDSMLFASSLWEVGNLSPPAYSKSVISQVDKLLAIGGFQTFSKKPYPSLAITIDPAKTLKHFQIREDIGGNQSFAVPDSFSVTQDMTPSYAAGGKNFSVRGQAELLRGLAAMTRYFRDWKKNGFDESLGAVQVGPLIKGLPAGAVSSGLFPKDSFFALGVANAAVILTNMTKQLSPVFLIDISRGTTWANDRTDSEAQPATMAGIVDIIDGKRGTTVHMADAARFMLALADFIDATQGIENTQSHPLITPVDIGDGKLTRPVDLLIANRSALTMAIIGVANFISHELASADGGIRSSFQQDTVTVNKNEPRRAFDQAIAIMALLRAGQVMDKTIYLPTALDAYAFMNAKLFNAKTGFYNGDESSAELPSADEIITILLAGEALRPHMSNQSADQWDKLSAPWVKALEALN